MVEYVLRTTWYPVHGCASDTIKYKSLSGCYSNSFGGKNHLFPVFVSLVGLIEDLAGNGEKLVTQARRFLP